MTALGTATMTTYRCLSCGARMFDGRLTADSLVVFKCRRCSWPHVITSGGARRGTELRMTMHLQDTRSP